MSLLMNEDFTVYQLRAGYLQNIKDGVGERLITLNTSVLNNPAFRSAGWTANPTDIKRTYSPPIPTAIASEYFQAPPRSAGLQINDDEEEGGMVTGHGSQDAIRMTPHSKRARRRKEQLDEEDSSDLSDDSDEDDDTKRAARQIKFNKMPVRNRAGSSPLRSSQPTDVNLILHSPSRPSDAPPVRRGSLSAVDFYTNRQRPRRDTTTSSEFSSENDFDASAFRKQKVQNRQIKNNHMFATRIEEEEQADVDADSDLEDEDEDVGEASDLSDEFEGTAESASLLAMGVPLVAVDTLEDSPIKEPPRIPPAVTPQSSSSPKRLRQPPPPDLPRLPTGRPISYVQPVSLLSKALKGTAQEPEDPFMQFAQLSGKGEASPLWIKIHAPFSTQSTKPFEVPLRRTTNDGAPVTVAELIGLALWRYAEEKREPPIPSADMRVNRWTLRMIEDDEVDFDFPALTRTRPVVDFTSNNNRPPMRRARDKPWDEFALVRATDEQFKENEELTPQFAVATQQVPTQSNTTLTVPPTIERTQTAPPPVTRTSSDALNAPSYVPNANPITSSFAPMARKNSTLPLLDAPAAPSAPRSTPRTGIPKTLTIHHTDAQSLQTTLLPVPTTTDTYIAEIFTLACQRLNLDKALHVLKVRGTQTVAPQDRTVEALGARLSLDLVRRRFVGVGDGWGAHSGAGSPGSAESPNAPLLMNNSGTTPSKTSKTKKSFMGLQSAKSATDMHAVAGTIYGLGNSAGKRYLVIRRQPLSFAPSHPRILALDADFMHIMPASSADVLLDSSAAGGGGVGPLAAGPTTPAPQPAGKTTSVHLSSVVGCKVSRKHPKVVRVLVYREKETKRYDFEAGSKEESAEIAGVINRGMLRFRDEEG